MRITISRGGQRFANEKSLAAASVSAVVRPHKPMQRFLLFVVFGLVGVALAFNLSGVQNDLMELSDSLTFYQISSLEPMGELFAFGALLPWFIAVGVASALIFKKLAYWTTTIAFFFSIVESVLLLHPSFQWGEGSTFAKSLPHVFICNCAVPISFASISVTLNLRCFQQVRVSSRDLFAATALVAAICGAVATRSQIAFSLAMLIASTWVAYSTTPRQNEAPATNGLAR